MGLIQNMVGDISWGGVKLTALSGAEKAAFRRTQIGMVFQDYPLFEELTPLGNASLGALFSPRDERAHLASNASALLAQLQVPKGARAAHTLSGGERQRVAVARALAHKPAVVLADEPTANLDRTTAREVTDVLLDYAKDRDATLIVASHDEALLDRVPRIVTLDLGKVVAP